MLHILSVGGGKCYLYTTVGSMTERDTRPLDKLVKKAGSALGRILESLGTVVERCTGSKVQAILDNVRYLLLNILASQWTSCSGRFISLHCRTEQLRRSFVSTNIRLYNISDNCRWS